MSDAPRSRVRRVEPDGLLVLGRSVEERHRPFLEDADRHGADERGGESSLAVTRAGGYCADLGVSRHPQTLAGHGHELAVSGPPVAPELAGPGPERAGWATATNSSISGTSSGPSVAMSQGRDPPSGWDTSFAHHLHARPLSRHGPPRPRFDVAHHNDAEAQADQLRHFIPVLWCRRSRGTRRRERRQGRTGPCLLAPFQYACSGPVRAAHTGLSRTESVECEAGM